MPPAAENRREPTRRPSNRQRDILQCFRRYCAEHGRPPTIREIADRVGSCAVSTVHTHMLELARRGYLTHAEDQSTRGFLLVEETTPAPVIDLPDSVSTADREEIAALRQTVGRLAREVTRLRTKVAELQNERHSQH